jgi:hypothetical protein
MDIVLAWTIVIYLAAFLLLGWFAMFARKLIKQHNDIYPLLYALEESDKKKERGDS